MVSEETKAAVKPEASDHEHAARYANFGLPGLFLKARNPRHRTCSARDSIGQRAARCRPVASQRCAVLRSLPRPTSNVAEMRALVLPGNLCNPTSSLKSSLCPGLAGGDEVDGEPTISQGLQSGLKISICFRLHGSQRGGVKKGESGIHRRHLYLWDGGLNHTTAFLPGTS